MRLLIRSIKGCKTNARCNDIGGVNGDWLSSSTDALGVVQSLEAN